MILSITLCFYDISNKKTVSNAIMVPEIIELITLRDNSLDYLSPINLRLLELYL